MFEKILNFIGSEEDHDPSFIRLVRNVLIFVMAATLAILLIVTGIAGIGPLNSVALIALSITFIVEAVSFSFALQGNILPAKVIVPIALIVAVTIIAINTNGIRDTSFFAVPVILVISTLLLGRRSLVIITPLAVVSAIAVAVYDISAKRDPLPIGVDDAIILPLLLITSAGITQIIINRLNEGTRRAQKSEQAQKKQNEELIALRASLEETVRERTVELEKANQISEKRARQFRAVAQVMSAISSVQSLDELLPLITRVISEQFEVYHTGVFLLDNNKELAVLRAANSEGGQMMLTRKHSLPVGQTGIVGFVTATGQPRIVLDVGADSIYFDNPNLPNTHSEIALPLRYGGQIIGALDVQSTEPNAFQADDVNVLTTLADQVAVAINNALTIEDANRSLAEAQSAVGRITLEAWQVLRPSKLGLGFSYSETGLKSLQQPIETPQIHEVLAKGETLLSSGPNQRSQLAIPLRLRGKVIGVMQLTTRNNNKFSDDDVDIAKAVMDRLSLAIETATLLQSTQHRADLERVTANITSKVSSSSRFETILQTAAQELSRALGGSEVLVQIEPAALSMYT